MPVPPAAVSVALTSGLSFPDHLIPKKRLGSGAYGTVFLCENRDTEERCAVKHIKISDGESRSTLREVTLLAQLRHDNLVHLLDFVALSGPDFTEALLVVPYFPTDLHKIIRSNQLRDTHIQAVTCQILRGLAYLHAAGVAHRDLKPANVLLDEKCNVKICDFGLARGDMYEDDVGGNEDMPALTEYIVTRWYRAPEVMLSPKMYTPAIDLFSVGCIIFEMFLGKALFPGKNHLDMIGRFTGVLGKPTDADIEWLPKHCAGRTFLKRCAANASDSSQLPELLAKARCRTSAKEQERIADLVQRLLSWDPAKRPSASDAQRHDYLRDFLPRTPPKMPEPFDWSFDRSARDSRLGVSHDGARQRLYLECARMHPDIIRRDHQHLKAKGWVTPRDASAPLSRSRTPPSTEERKLKRTESRTSSVGIVSRSSTSTAYADRIHELARGSARQRSKTNPHSDTFRPPARSLGRRLT